MYWKPSMLAILVNFVVFGVHAVCGASSACSAEVHVHKTDSYTNHGWSFVHNGIRVYFNSKYYNGHAGATNVGRNRVVNHITAENADSSQTRFIYQELLYRNGHKELTIASWEYRDIHITVERYPPDGLEVVLIIQGRRVLVAMPKNDLGGFDMSYNNKEALRTKILKFNPGVESLLPKELKNAAAPEKPENGVKDASGIDEDGTEEGNSGSAFGPDKVPRGPYIGIIQVYENPEENMVAESVEPVHVVFEENGDFAVVEPSGKKETLLKWKDGRWRSPASQGLRVEASWQRLGTFVVIDYLTYADDELVDKCRFFLTPEPPKGTRREDAPW